MRIPDEWLDAVFFLGTSSSENAVEIVKYRGTGFVLSAPNEFAPPLRRLYLVTAAHNIEGARKGGQPLDSSEHTGGRLYSHSGRPFQSMGPPP